jgi:hypothetical protein
LKPFVETNCFLLPPGWERAIHHTHDRREILQDDWKLVCTRASNSNQIAIERGEQLMARSSFVRRTLLVASVLVASALPAVAQNAQVTGIVKDQTGGVLPGVTTTARNQETGLLRTGVTDGTGEFRLPALPPGSYTLTAELQGFTTESQRDLVLVIGQTATVNLTLKPAVLAESITVTSSAPMVDTTRSDITTTVSSQQIQNLPLANTRWIAFALLTPGVSQDNIRSQYYSGTIDVGGGGREYSNAYVVDGANNTWQEMGEPRQEFAMDSIREFKVTTSNFKAEYGLATGGLVEVVSKSGTNDLHGSGMLFYRNESLTALQAFQTVKPPYSRYQDGGSIGGRLVKDKTHFFFAYERTDEELGFTTNTRGLWPQYDGTYQSKQKRWNYTAKIDQQLGSSQSFFVRFAQEGEYRPIVNSGGKLAPSGAFDFAVPRDSAVVGHTWVINERMLNDFRGQYAFSEYEISPPNTPNSLEVGVFSTPPDNCTDRYVYPSLQIGGCQESLGPETRWQFKDDFSYLMRRWGGTHQWKMGIDYSHILFQSSGVGSGPSHGTWTFPKDTPYNAADPSTYPTQYTNSLPSYYAIPTNNFSAYLQDDWQTPISGLTVNLGIRYDVQRGAFNENLTNELSLISDKLGSSLATYPVPIPFVDTTIRGDRNNFGPRIGLAWDPTGSGLTNFHAAYGLYYDNIRTLLNGAELSWQESQAIVINKPSFPDPLQGKSRSAFISTAPPNIEVLSNRLVNPYAHQVNAGMTRTLARNLTASVDFAWNNSYHDRQQAIDINMPDPVTRAKPYPQFGRVMYNDPDYSHFYRALLVKIDKRMADNFQLLASYTLSKNTDEQRLNAIGDTAAYSWPVLSYPGVADRRHRLVVSGTAQLPHQMQISVIGDLRSSLPFQPATGVDLNGDGYSGGANYYTGDNPPGVGYNSGCRDLNLDAVNAFRASRGLASVSSVACPDYANLDVRFAKSFVFARSQRLELIVQLFNAFNRANYADGISSPLSSAFGQVNQLPPNLNAPSRQVELAFRYGF